MSSRDGVYDAIVVGAGIVGSGAAYFLARQNCKTLLLEQFALPHTRGSSHGQSRIIRKAYPEGDYYNELLKHAYKFWDHLQKESQTKLFIKTGTLLITTPDDQQMVDTKRVLEKGDSPHTMFSPAEFRHKYPQFAFSADTAAILDPDGGLLKAHKALTTIQDMFRKHGGKIKDETRVTDIIPGDTVTVLTNKGNFCTKRLIITPGPWAEKILKPLGVNVTLVPTRVSACYWKAPSSAYSIAGGFPTFIGPIDYTADGRLVSIYGLPAEEYENCIKVCLHEGEPADPDTRDAYGTNWDIETLQGFMRRHFPGVQDKPCIVEKCMYTVTDDEDFILDYHPHWKNIIIGCGFSGHGFKFGGITGQLLGELALGKPTLCDMTPFKMARFTEREAKSKL